MEVQVAHCVIEAFVSHRATRAQVTSKHEVVHVLREEWVGLALAGCQLKPVQPVRSPMPAVRSGCCTNATSAGEASGRRSERIGRVNHPDRTGGPPAWDVSGGP
jgi:hypothetical protein